MVARLADALAKRAATPPFLFYPLLFMKLRPEASGLVVARLARAEFGSRIGRATYPKHILIKVSLTVALLLAGFHDGAGSADRHQNQSARMVGIGRFPVLH